MDSVPQLPLHYINNLLGLVESLGGSGKKLLADSRIDRDMLNDFSRTITLDQFTFLLKHSIELTREPALGLLLGSNMTITNHGALGLAAMSSATLGEAAVLLAQYIQVRTPLIDINLIQTADTIELRIAEVKSLSDARVVYLETVMSALMGAMSFIALNQCRPSRIECSYAEPSYSTLYEGIFSCAVCFDQAHTSMFFPAEQMSIPLSMHDKMTHLQAKAQCDKEFIRVDDDIVIRIKRRLAANKGPFPSLERVAQEFNVSSRTLRRRLANGATTFQCITDQVRQDLAVNYLTSTKLSVGEIAFFLGYNDPSNFGRAFKKWLGVSPATYRENHFNNRKV